MASGVAPIGTRTTIPERNTTSAVGSATTRSGTKAGASPRGDPPGGAARMRRQRSKFDRVSFRSRQNALTDRPDQPALCRRWWQASMPCSF
jgi:hypothetical protein